MRRLVTIAGLIISIALLGIIIARSMDNKAKGIPTTLKTIKKFYESEIPDYFMPSMDKKDRIVYTNLVKRSLRKDLTSLRELIDYPADGAYGYRQGILIVKIARHIGEEPFIELIPKIYQRERDRLQFLLEVGIENHVSDELAVHFPHINHQLEFYSKNPFCQPPLERSILPLC